MATATAGSLVAICPRCGTVYPIDRDAILLGVWRLGCPACHPPPPPPVPSPVPSPDPPDDAPAAAGKPG